MNQTEILLTLPILKDNFFFDITDMGDFWIAKKQSIQLIQPKNEIINSHFNFQIITENENVLKFLKEIKTVSDLQYLARLTNEILLFTI